MANIIHMPKTASIFDSEMKVLVNPVNTQGRSGKGLALEFAKRYPDTEAEYVAWCKNKVRQGGDVLKCTHYKHPHTMIVYACTKQDPRAPSEHEWVDIIMHSEIWYQLSRGYYNTFAIPALGCGLFDLKWDTVRPIIEAAFADIDTIVELYPPR